MESGKATKARRRKSLNVKVGKSTDRRKKTIILSAKNDRRLSILAALRDVDRSALLDTILNKALEGVTGYATGETEQGEAAA